jgi:hypothetical protein
MFGRTTNSVSQFLGRKFCGRKCLFESRKLPPRANPICRDCRIALTNENWFLASQHKRDYTCKSCVSKKSHLYNSEPDVRSKRLKRAKEYRVKNLDMVKVRDERYTAENHHKSLVKVQQHHHPENPIPTCWDCGETNEVVLEKEHINNNGKQERDKFGHTIDLAVIRGHANLDELIILCSSCHVKRELKKDEEMYQNKLSDPTIMGHKRTSMIGDRQRSKKYRQDAMAILARGGAMISVDGEKDPDKWEIGHMFGDGKEQRRLLNMRVGRGWYRFIIQNPDMIDLLGLRIESANYNRLQARAPEQLNEVHLGTTYDPEKAKALKGIFKTEM